MATATEGLGASTELASTSFVAACATWVDILG